MADNDESSMLLLRVADLVDALEDIAMLADGHRRSIARDADGNNIALTVILARAAELIGKADRLRETGTIFTNTGTVVGGRSPC